MALGSSCRALRAAAVIACVCAQAAIPFSAAAASRATASTSSSTSSITSSSSSSALDLDLDAAVPTLANLRVEYAVQPITVDNPSPRFTWTFVPSPSSPGTQRQAGFNITVSTTTSSSSSLVYASAFVEGPSTVAIFGEDGGTVYSQLQSDTDYTWTVNSLASDGSGWVSATSTFSTALFSQADWQGASWIGGYNQLRTTFTLPSQASITRARLYVTAAGIYKAFLNGQEISRPGLGANANATFVNPGFSTVYTARVLYNTYDVASSLSPTGPNALGLRLGQGTYGYLGMYCVGSQAQCLRAIALLVVVQSDGTRTLIVTRGTAEPSPPMPLRHSSSSSSASSSPWLGTQNEILFNHFYNGEIVDHSLANDAWCSPSFTPSPPAWSPVASFPSPTAQLTSHSMPQVSAYETRAAVSVNTVKPSGGEGQPVYVFDVGLNGAGICTINFPGPVQAGVNVSLTFAELLNGDGSAYVQFACPSPCCLDGGNCANQTYYFRTRGDAGGESYQPSFAYAGFRYVQVANWPSPSSTPPSPSLLTCNITTSAVESAGSVVFNSSTGFVLNAIQSAVVRSQRANTHSIPTDCPQREKRGWTADAHVTSRQASLNFFMAGVYENWLVTHADTVATGCGNLTANWTCPKWQKDQPGEEDEDGAGMGGGGAVEWWGQRGVVAPTSSSSPYSLPNCFICCYGRPGFGCQSNMPTNTTGASSDVVPFHKNGYGSFPGSICWTSSFFVVAEVLLERYASTQALEKVYPFLAAHFDFYNANTDAKNGLLQWETYGDWNAISSTTHLFAADCYFAADALTLAKIALAIGQEADAVAYLARANAISVATGSVFLNMSCGSGGGGGEGTTGAVCWDTGSQAANAIPLSLGVGGPSVANFTQSIATALVNDVVNIQGTHVTVGTIGSRHILQALSIIGRGDVALALANQTTLPSWGYFVVTSPLKLGTLWEQWDGGTSSYDHTMFGGGIGAAMHEIFLGLTHNFRRAGGERGSNNNGGEGEAEVEGCLAAIRGVSHSYLRKDLSLTPGQICALADVVRGMTSSSSSRSIEGLRRRAKVALLSRRRHTDGSGSGSLVSRISLRLDAEIVKALGSASGHLDTIGGRTSAEWHFSSSSVRVVFAVPHAAEGTLVVPLGLLRELHEESVLTLRRRGSAAATVEVRVGKILAMPVGSNGGDQGQGGQGGQRGGYDEEGYPSWSIVTAVEALEHDFANAAFGNGHTAPYALRFELGQGEWVLDG